MIHRIRFKTVISLQLFKSSDVMQQSDQLSQLPVFFGKSQSLCNLTAVFRHSVCVDDLQPYLIIFPVITRQIFFKFSFCPFKFHIFLLNILK